MQELPQAPFIFPEAIFSAGSKEIGSASSSFEPIPGGGGESFFSWEIEKRVENFFSSQPENKTRYSKLECMTFVSLFDVSERRNLFRRMWSWWCAKESKSEICFLFHKSTAIAQHGKFASCGETPIFFLTPSLSPSLGREERLRKNITFVRTERKTRHVFEGYPPSLFFMLRSTYPPRQ